MAQQIRIRYAESGNNRASDFEDWLEGWSVAMPDRTTFRLVDSDKLPSIDTSYYEATVYLDDNEDLDTALSELSEDIFVGIKWYIVHTVPDCTHDTETKSSACNFEIADERGNVPEDYR